MSVILQSSGGGQITIQEPTTASNFTQTLPAASGEVVLYFAPQVTVYTSGSGTYTVPTGAKYLKIEMCGAGGGGAGAGIGGSFGGAGTAGGNTTFGTSLLSCNGGGAGTPAGGASAGGTGGTASISSPAVGYSLQGGSGAGPTIGNANQITVAMAGGVNAFGGSNAKNNSTITANTGAGGYGPVGVSSGSIGYTGTGGGAGGYSSAIIPSPAASYSYAVGAGGAGGAAGGGGSSAGSAGSSGIIVITAYFG
jgi:hypothetical protein